MAKPARCRGKQACAATTSNSKPGKVAGKPPAANNEGKSLVEQRSLNMVEDIFRTHNIEEMLDEEFSKKSLGMHLLLIVCSVGYDKGLDQLIAAGVNITVQHELDGNTALHIAAKLGREETMKKLIDADESSINMTNFAGNTPIMDAVHVHCSTAVKLLWKHRKYYDVNRQNRYGNTILHLAAWSKQQPWEPCIGMLLEHPHMRVDIRNYVGDTALGVCAMRGSLASCHRLLQHRADILIENREGSTALCLAAKKGKMDIYTHLFSQLDAAQSRAFIERRLQLLRSLPDTNDTDDYLCSTLYPVLGKLCWEESARRMLYDQQLVPAWMTRFMKHLEHAEAATKATHFLFELLATNNQFVRKYGFVEQFIDSDGPEKIIEALEYYSENITAPHNYEIIVSCLLLIMPIVESKRKAHAKWLAKNYYRIMTYMNIFETNYKDLEYVGSQPKLVKTMWDKFSKEMNETQERESRRHGEELLQIVERERSRKERKRQKKKQKRNNAKMPQTTDSQKAPCEESTNENDTKIADRDGKTVSLEGDVDLVEDSVTDITQVPADSESSTPGTDHCQRKLMTITQEKADAEEESPENDKAENTPRIKRDCDVIIDEVMEKLSQDENSCSVFARKLRQVDWRVKLRSVTPSPTPESKIEGGDSFPTKASEFNAKEVPPTTCPPPPVNSSDNHGGSRVSVSGQGHDLVPDSVVTTDSDLRKGKNGNSRSQNPGRAFPLHPGKVLPLLPAPATESITRTTHATTVSAPNSLKEIAPDVPKTSTKGTELSQSKKYAFDGNKSSAQYPPRDQISPIVEKVVSSPDGLSLSQSAERKSTKTGQVTVNADTGSGYAVGSGEVVCGSPLGSTARNSDVPLESNSVPSVVGPEPGHSEQSINQSSSRELNKMAGAAAHDISRVESAFRPTDVGRDADLTREIPRPDSVLYESQMKDASLPRQSVPAPSVKTAWMAAASVLNRIREGYSASQNLQDDEAPMPTKNAGAATTNGASTKNVASRITDRFPWITNRSVLHKIKSKSSSSAEDNSRSSETTSSVSNEDQDSSVHEPTPTASSCTQECDKASTSSTAVTIANSQGLCADSSENGGLATLVACAVTPIVEETGNCDVHSAPISVGTAPNVDINGNQEIEDGGGLSENRSTSSMVDSDTHSPLPRIQTDDTSKPRLNDAIVKAGDYRSFSEIRGTKLIQAGDIYDIAVASFRPAMVDERNLMTKKTRTKHLESKPTPSCRMDPGSSRGEINSVEFSEEKQPQKNQKQKVSITTDAPYKDPDKLFESQSRLACNSDRNNNNIMEVGMTSSRSVSAETPYSDSVQAMDCDEAGVRVSELPSQFEPNILDRFESFTKQTSPQIPNCVQMLEAADVEAVAVEQQREGQILTPVEGEKSESRPHSVTFGDFGRTRDICPRLNNCNVQGLGAYIDIKESNSGEFSTPSELWDVTSNPTGLTFGNFNDLHINEPPLHINECLQAVPIATGSCGHEDDVLVVDDELMVDVKQLTGEGMDANVGSSPADALPNTETTQNGSMLKDAGQVDQHVHMVVPTAQKNVQTAGSSDAVLLRDGELDEGERQMLTSKPTANRTISLNEDTSAASEQTNHLDQLVSMEAGKGIHTEKGGGDSMIESFKGGKSLHGGDHWREQCTGHREGSVIENEPADRVADEIFPLVPPPDAWHGVRCEGTRTRRSTGSRIWSSEGLSDLQEGQPEYTWNDIPSWDIMGSGDPLGRRPGFGQLFDYTDTQPCVIDENEARQWLPSFLFDSAYDEYSSRSESQHIYNNAPVTINGPVDKMLMNDGKTGGHSDVERRDKSWGRPLEKVEQTINIRVGSHPADVAATKKAGVSNQKNLFYPRLSDRSVEEVTSFHANTVKPRAVQPLLTPQAPPAAPTELPRIDTTVPPPNYKPCSSSGRPLGKEMPKMWGGINSIPQFTPSVVDTKPDVWDDVTMINEFSPSKNGTERPATFHQPNQSELPPSVIKPHATRPVKALPPNMPYCIPTPLHLTSAAPLTGSPESRLTAHPAAHEQRNTASKIIEAPAAYKTLNLGSFFQPTAVQPLSKTAPYRDADRSQASKPDVTSGHHLISKLASALQTDITKPPPSLATQNGWKLAISKRMNQPVNLNTAFIPRVQAAGSAVDINVLKQMSGPRVKRIHPFRFMEDPRFFIGTSSWGESVYAGLYNESIRVAVKKISAARAKFMLETTFCGSMNKLGDHANLLPYMGVYEDAGCSYLLTAACQSNLAQHLAEAGTPPHQEQHLRQLTHQMMYALEFLHSSDVTHGNLKPENVLIDCHGNVKLADYNNYYRNVQVIGLVKWLQGIAPWTTAKKVVWNDIPGAKKADIQVAGMLIYYTLTKGCHPFGRNVTEIERNIGEGRMRMQHLSTDADDLLQLRMLCHQPERRLDAHLITRHVYFWNKEKRFGVLLDMAKECHHAKTNVQTLCSMSRLNLIHLEELAFGQAWLQLVDTCLIREVEDASGRMYLPVIMDLLLFIEATTRLQQTLSPETRGILGEASDYFLSRFTSLPVKIYCVFG